MIRPLLLAAAALCAPVALRAQLQPLAGRLDAPTLSALQAVVDSARSRGLPVQPLVSKAQEGTLKRASGTTIVQAVRALAAQLASARTTLGDEATAAELEAGAMALRAGLPVEVLREVRRARAGGGAALPLVVAAELVARGVPPTTAAETIVALARANATDGAFDALRRGVEADIRDGTAPAQAATVRARGVLGGAVPR